MQNKYLKTSSESEEDYIYRICSMKEAIGSWRDVAIVLNENLGYDYDESCYRKKYQTLLRMVDGMCVNPLTNESLSQLQEERRELEKEKIKVRDERNEYRRILREQARKESFSDLFMRTLLPYASKEAGALQYRSQAFTSQPETEIIVHLTDVHHGISIKNFSNEYDGEILKSRLKQYLNKIVNVADRHNAVACHLVLGGDMISGAIHTNLRIENNANVIEQVMQISELVSDFTYELSHIFDQVYVHSVSGNHSRVFPNKENNAKGEYLDALIPHHMKARLQNQTNVTISNNAIDESIASFQVCGRLWYAVHGDKDTASNIVPRLTMFTGQKPYACLMGHRHTNGISTVYDTKVIESGCVSGADNYCMDNRLRNKPEQNIIVCSNATGIDCVYDFQMD